MISSRKALDSLAGRDSGDPQHFREQAQRDIDALNDTFNKKIADLEQVKHIFSITFPDICHMLISQFLSTFSKCIMSDNQFIFTNF